MVFPLRMLPWRKHSFDMVTLNDIQSARGRIHPYIEETPVVTIGDEVFLKLENRQPIVHGFKIRGAANAMIRLRASSVMTSALGTHGFAVGYVGKQLGIHTICMMIKNPPKIAEEKMKQLVDEVLYGTDEFASTEQMALAYAREHGIPFVHPYNNLDVIAGQGTIGLEILEQVPEIKTVYVPIGGGGLISGMAVALKTLRPDLRVVGVQPAVMHAMATSVEKGCVTKVPQAVSQAEKLAVNFNPETMTFDLVCRLVDEFLTPNEVQIRDAMQYIYERTGEVVEGAGAISYAAACLDAKRQGRLLCVVSGGNISKEDFQQATGIKVA